MKFKNIKKKSPPAGGKKAKSPSNSRTITDLQSRFPKIDHIALFRFYRRVLKVFVVVIFIVAVIIVGLDFQENLKIKQGVDSQREVLIKDLNFWEGFISKHQNYPDAYFQTSILEYKLGNTFKAKTYVEKGLSLDPNSTEGMKIKELLK